MDFGVRLFVLIGIIFSCSASNSSNTQKFDSDVSPCVARRKCLHPYPIKRNKAHTGGLSRLVRENKGYGNEHIVFHSLYSCSAFLNFFRMVFSFFSAPLSVISSDIDVLLIVDFGSFPKQFRHIPYLLLISFLSVLDSLPKALINFSFCCNLKNQSSVV